MRHTNEYPTGSYFIIYELNKFMDLDRLHMKYHQYREAIHHVFYHYPRYNHTAETVLIEAIRL